MQLNLFLRLAGGCFIAILFTGCVAPKATVLAKEPLTKYKRLYVGKPNPDPRDVHPRMLARLRGLGLDVYELGSGVHSQGSGFVVSSNGAVLTCAHVLGTNLDATVWIKGQRFEARVVSSDTNLDLALLKLSLGVTNSPLPPLAVSTQQLKLAQPVFTMGFPLTEILGKAPRLNQGILSATVGYEDNPRQYQVSAEVQPGNSGGPLFTADGQVVGVMTGTLNPLSVLLRTGGNLPQNVNFAIKGETTAEFLRTNGISSATGDKTNSFEQIQKSLALIRSGIIPPGEEDAPELLCVYSYVSFWDMWYRFRFFQVVFYDVKTRQPVLRAGQNGDSVLTTEEAVMDRTFVEIKQAFKGNGTPPGAK